MSNALLALSRYRSQGRAFGSGRIRLLHVKGDSMEPTCKRDDYVLYVPIKRTFGDGLYVIECAGEPVINRVSTHTDRRGHVRLSYDNPRYARTDYVPRQVFMDGMLGYVVATVNIKDHQLLWEAING